MMMMLDDYVSQQMADIIRFVLLALLIIFSLWSLASTLITFRNSRNMTGKNRERTRWIYLIFLFLLLSGVMDSLLTAYRIGKPMSGYLFLLYLGQTIIYGLIVISASGFMLSLFGGSFSQWWQGIHRD